MMQGIEEIIAHVPKSVFLGDEPPNILISFDNLDAMYRLKKLNVNLISLWCM
ncbi:hypothetical protein HU200_021398 [Digitaria exilis]|uniref:Uncharacterized protein n=1 Tax=Digitaria exilis TaxID=1010633 RepID=A0A835F0B9_9POAL|nr:hypothetical protein HU200_021398 [Digitaria exilis]